MVPEIWYPICSSDWKESDRADSGMGDLVIFALLRVARKCLKKYDIHRPRLGLTSPHPGGLWVGRDWIRVGYLAASGSWGRGGLVSSSRDLRYFCVWEEHH